MTDSFAGNVIRVDNATGLVTPLAVGPGPSGIAVGGGGVWVAVTGADKVVRIDPGTRAVTDTIAVGRSPTGVSVGAGSVWVANSGDGTVTRIDPTTNQPNATIAVGGSPQAITIAGGRAWVTVDAQTIPSTTLASGGGRARVDSPYDVDTMDPALAYDTLLWQLLYATCAKLLNYPDKAGLAGSRARARGRAVAAGALSRRQDLHVHDPQRLSFLAAVDRAGHRPDVQVHDRAHPQPGNEEPGRQRVPLTSSAPAPTWPARSAHIAGVIARANTLTIRLIEPAPNLPARLAQPAFCAVPSDTPTDPRGSG